MASSDPGLLCTTNAPSSTNIILLHMATDLKPFKEAYATMTVATYEPLILRWISLLGVRFIAHGLADRYAKARYVRADHRLPTVMGMNRTMRRALPASCARRAR